MLMQLQPVTDFKVADMIDSTVDIMDRGFHFLCMIHEYLTDLNKILLIPSLRDPYYQDR